MAKITHDEQRAIWEKEHQTPYALLQVNAKSPSQGVILFWEWLQEHHMAKKGLSGLDICCGKGRNSIWLASKGVQMQAFDFSNVAIQESRQRALEAGIDERVEWLSHDATVAWPYPNGRFDFVLDCYASTDIETAEGRFFARNEISRVLRPGGYLLVHTLSHDDQYHREMMAASQADDPHSFIHPMTGKFEKTFTRDELVGLYSDLTLVAEDRIRRTTEFFGKAYDCHSHWLVFQKVGC